MSKPDLKMLCSEPSVRIVGEEGNVILHLARRINHHKSEGVLTPTQFRVNSVLDGTVLEVNPKFVTIKGDGPEGELFIYSGLQGVEKDLREGKKIKIGDSVGIVDAATKTLEESFVLSAEDARDNLIDLEERVNSDPGILGAEEHEKFLARQEKLAWVKAKEAGELSRWDSRPLYDERRRPLATAIELGVALSGPIQNAASYFLPPTLSSESTEEYSKAKDEALSRDETSIFNRALFNPIDEMRKSTRALAVGLAVVAVAGSSGRAGSITTSSLAALAVAATTALLPISSAEQIKKINDDIKQIESSLKKSDIGDVFVMIKSYFRYMMGWLPVHHDMPQDYKDNVPLMDFLRTMVQVNKLEGSADLAREALSSESYLQTLAVIEAISNVYKFDDRSKREKQIITKAIFCDKTSGYDHNFFHLLGVPLVQGDEVATSNYKLVLQGTKDFLAKSKFPIKHVFGQDKEGNNPLHVLAAVTPFNQFKAFIDVFGDLIPQDIFLQRNNHGHSPLDILGSDEVQKEATNYISKAMKGNFIINAAATSRSDMLHKPGSLEVMYGPESVVVTRRDPVTKKIQPTLFTSYPKAAYSKNPDGTYNIMDLLNGGVLETISADVYHQVKAAIPEGTSYAVVAFESRAQKLQLVTERAKSEGESVASGAASPEPKSEVPKPEVSKPKVTQTTSSTLSPKSGLKTEL